MADFCSACGAATPAGGRFCPACGAPAGAAADLPTSTGFRAGAPVPRVGRLASSDTIPVGGHPPGAVLADRFRIIGLIGRGGMGEVYRADDLKLGQPVALKFLPPSLRQDPVRRERFLAEVRIARQVSHPNVCRVYDVGELDVPGGGTRQHFLSMEYIDGEDLASLLTRIGYLPSAKALEIARQLAAGLAAAHDKGVLHRDLKPANVMLDGRGRVRITDFGLAVAADPAARDATGGAGMEVAGTPAYMAPEQLAGEPATVRSDIYALGLVLYELCTGQRAFTAATLADLRHQKSQGTPPAPSEITREVDPAVERVIQRCLDPDPRARPASVLQVAAALPGGDPLAAALAAGETPSPELVAASASGEGLRPAVAWTLLTATLAALAPAVFLAESIRAVVRMAPAEPPAVFASRARDVLRRAGYDTAAGDSAYGLEIDRDYVRHLQTGVPEAREGFAPHLVVFWYRQSPVRLWRRNFLQPAMFSSVRSYDPRLYRGGDAIVWLDASGRLLGFEAIPPQFADANGPVALPDWASLLGEAGLEPADWRPAEPRWVPPAYADARAAWEPAGAPGADARIRVEAAAFRGRPVYFRAVYPWTRPDRDLPERVAAGERAASIVLLGLFGALIVGGVVLARRNVRIGRGDRRGAARLAVPIMALMLVSWLLDEKHIPSVWQAYLILSALSWIVFCGGLVWVMYLALEPFVRRNWPSTIASWTRLLTGGAREPLVGRDVLIGCLAGAVSFSLFALDAHAPVWLGDTVDFRFPSEFILRTFLGTPHVISFLAYTVAVSVFVGLSVLFLWVLLRLLLRHPVAAGLAFVLLYAGPTVISSANPWTTVAFAGAGTAVLLLLTMRVGLVALISAFVTTTVLGEFPISTNASAWFAPIGGIGLLAIVALAIYGFRTSLGGRPAFGGATLDERL